MDSIVVIDDEQEIERDVIEILSSSPRFRDVKDKSYNGISITLDSPANQTNRLRCSTDKPGSSNILDSLLVSSDGVDPVRTIVKSIGYHNSPIKESNTADTLELPATQSSQDSIDASSSIGEIKVSKVYTKKPLRPISQFQYNRCEPEQKQEQKQNQKEKQRHVGLFYTSDDEIENSTEKEPQENSVSARTRNEVSVTETKRMLPIKLTRLSTPDPPPVKLPSSPSFQPAIRSHSESIINVEPKARLAKRQETIPDDGTNKRRRKTSEEKELAKKRIAGEKASRKLFQQANKSNRLKEDLLEEMILVLPKSFLEMLKELEHLPILAPVEIKEDNTDKNIITWKRKTMSTYNPIRNLFIPSPPKIMDEKICCMFFDPAQFIELIESDDSLSTLKHTLEKGQYNELILLVWEYETCLKGIRAKENKLYTDAVRSMMSEESQPPSDKQIKKSKSKYSSTLTSMEIESRVSKLQINGIKVFPTKNIHETVLFLRSFTYTISSARYDKYEKHPEFANIGTVKSGKDRDDTYIQMLTQFKSITEAKAAKISEVLPSVRHLYNAVNQRKELPLDRDGKKLVSQKIEKTIVQMFTTLDDQELVHQDM